MVLMRHSICKLEKRLLLKEILSQNDLKLNTDKTEILVMGTPQMRAKISIPSITINGVTAPVLN